MTQKQKDTAPVGGVPDSSLHGNPDAAAAAAKARDTLAIEVKPQEPWNKYLDRIEADGSGIFDGSVIRRDAFEEYVKAGIIDPETMTWTARARAMHPYGMICFCLVPSCTIGPFIPIRR